MPKRYGEKYKAFETSEGFFVHSFNFLIFLLFLCIYNNKKSLGNYLSVDFFLVSVKVNFLGVLKIVG